jgi:hypothetical protein
MGEHEYVPMKTTESGVVNMTSVDCGHTGFPSASCNTGVTATGEPPESGHPDDTPASAIDPSDVEKRPDWLVKCRSRVALRSPPPASAPRVRL